MFCPPHNPLTWPSLTPPRTLSYQVFLWCLTQPLRWPSSYDPVSYHHEPSLTLSYQVILPWVHQFDHLYTSCGVWWFAPRRLANTTCVYVMPDDVTPMHRYTSVKSFGAHPVKSFGAHPVKSLGAHPVKSFDTHPVKSSSSNNDVKSATSNIDVKSAVSINNQHPLRVHVSNELPRYHQHFLKSVLPYYEEQWRNGTISGLIVHSGSGDTPVPSRIANVTNWMTDWMTDLLSTYLIDWLTDWLTPCSSSYMLTHLYVYQWLINIY